MGIVQDKYTVLRKLVLEYGRWFRTVMAHFVVKKNLRSKFPMAPYDKAPFFQLKNTNIFHISP